MEGSTLRIHIFKFRPSSHSDDYTLIATYKDMKKAEKVGEALKKLLKDMQKHMDDYETDWNPDEAHVSVSGSQVWFEVYTGGYLDDAESVIRKVAIPENVECYRNYQELTVRVKVPKGLTPEAAMVVLNKEEAEAIRWFNETCGKPTVNDCEGGEHQILEWYYRGDEIYYDNSLYVGFEFYIGDRDDWEVDY